MKTIGSWDVCQMKNSRRVVHLGGGVERRCGILDTKEFWMFFDGRSK